MSCLFIEYPKCTTCKKAAAWLKEKGISFEDRNIVEENPTKEEILSWIQESGLPAKKFFNTCGLKYKSLGLKNKLADMSTEEQAELLASDGMLVKRPILLANGHVCVGFKGSDWEKALEI